MIAVVADDLTGAAELAGIGLRYGLQVQLTTSVAAASKADLLVIATDTRSQSQDIAAAITSKVVQQLACLQPRLIFRKIDSVLRGHVLAEMQAQMQALHCQKALIVSANPALGRTISGGTYYLQGKPIHESSFSQDPEFPVLSSRITDMVRATEAGVQVLPVEAPRPPAGIVIGEASSVADLQAWAGSVDADTALAGASGFFTALLEACYPGNQPRPAPALHLGEPRLYVCGSTFAQSRQLVKAEKEAGGPVSYLPRELMANSPSSEAQLAGYAGTIAALLQERRRALIAIDPATTAALPISAGRLRELTAQAVEQVFWKTPVEELLVEGGATAAAILARLQLHHFTPVQELAPGVIRMQAGGFAHLHLTLKPGSYEWPAALWHVTR